MYSSSDIVPCAAVVPGSAFVAGRPVEPLRLGTGQEHPMNNSCFIITTICT